MADDLQSKATDLVKKVLTVGVGAVFMTEESLRNMVSEFKLPKELLSGVLESATKTKKEFFQNLSQDIIAKLQNRIDPQAFLEEFLKRNEIDLHIKMSFKPKKPNQKED